MFAKLTSKLRSLAFAGVAALAASTIVAPAPAIAAEEVYIAQDYNDGAAKHGFWSNPNNNGTTGVTDPFFSFDGDEVIFTLDEMADFATLVGTAANGTDTAYLNLLFTGYSADLPVGNTFKDAGGHGDSGADFFTNVSGTITINGVEYTVVDFAGTTLFQYGWGATDKAPYEYGGSAWLLLADANGNRLSHHVDLNFSLTPAVPEPATWMMLLMGFFAMGGILRHSRRKGQLVFSAS